MAGYGQGLGHDMFGRYEVFRLDEHRVLKKSRGGLRESDTMKFIAANTTIPVPKVYGTKLDGEGELSYIVMEYVPGESLEDAWIKLSPDQRVSALHQIAQYLSELQQLTGKRIKGVNDTSVRVGGYHSRWGGPFETEKEFNDFLAHYTQGTQGPHLLPVDNHIIHFAHGDLSPRNIMVNKSGQITAIIDWEWAGWMPEYWDILRMRMDLPGKSKMPDYGNLFRSTFPPKYQKEYWALVYLSRFEPLVRGGLPFLAVWFSILRANSAMGKKKGKKERLHKASNSASMNESNSYSALPEVLPYRDRCCYLLAGRNAESYTVPYYFLKDHPCLLSKIGPSSLSDPPRTVHDHVVRFVDLDENIAHTMVHFLYIGEYKTLRLSVPESKNVEMENKYRRSVAVFSFASKYELSPLVALAMEVMEKTCKSVSWLVALDVGSKEYKELCPKHRLWFDGHIRAMLQSMFEDDGNMFIHRDILKHVKGSFSRMLFRLTPDDSTKEAIAERLHAKYAGDHIPADPHGPPFPPPDDRPCQEARLTPDNPPDDADIEPLEDANDPLEEPAADVAEEAVLRELEESPPLP
ncbi:hypothetical protein RJZ90_007366 [Blastomyces dermatitidis]